MYPRSVRIIAALHPARSVLRYPRHSELLYPGCVVLMNLRSVLPKTHSVLLKPRNTNETSLRIAESLLVIHESSLSFHESSLRMVEDPSSLSAIKMMKNLQ